MRFFCESCHRKYEIPDERVRGKRVLVRCSGCGHEIKIQQPAMPGYLDANHLAPEDGGVWYYSVNGQMSEPLSLEKIQEVFSSGIVGDEAYVWQQSFGDDWKPVRSVDLFAEALAEGDRKTFRRQTQAFMGDVRSEHLLQSTKKDEPVKDPEPRLDKIESLRRKLHKSSQTVEPSDANSTFAKKSRASDKRRTLPNPSNERKTKLSLANPLSEEGRALLEHSRAMRAAQAREEEESRKLTKEAPSQDRMNSQDDVSGAKRSRSRDASSRPMASVSPLSAVRSDAEMLDKSDIEKDDEPKNHTRTRESAKSAAAKNSQKLAAISTTIDTEISASSHPYHAKQMRERTSSKWLLPLVVLIAVVGSVAAYYVLRRDVDETVTTVAVVEQATPEDEMPDDGDGADEDVEAAPDEETTDDIAENKAEPEPEPPAQQPLELPRPVVEDTPTTAIDESDDAQVIKNDSDTFRSARTASSISFKRPAIPDTQPKQLTREQALEGIKKVSQSVELCRERHVRRGGEFNTPKILVALTVAGTGDVTDFTLEPEALSATEFGRCMKSHRPRWKFFAFGGPPQKVNRRFIIQQNQ